MGRAKVFFGVVLPCCSGASASNFALDPQQSRIVELRFFAGLTVEETAEILNVHPLQLGDCAIPDTLAIVHHKIRRTTKMVQSMSTSCAHLRALETSARALFRANG
jgi:Sigma-70, region 4